MSATAVKITQIGAVALVLASVFGWYQDPAFLWLLATQAWTCL